MSAHHWFIVALVAAILGVGVDLYRRALPDAITCAVLGLMAVAFIVSTH